MPNQIQGLERSNKSRNHSELSPAMRATLTPYRMWKVLKHMGILPELSKVCVYFWILEFRCLGADEPSAFSSHQHDSTRWIHPLPVWSPMVPWLLFAFKRFLLRCSNFWQQIRTLKRWSINVAATKAQRNAKGTSQANEIPVTWLLHGDMNSNEHLVGGFNPSEKY